MDTPANNGGVSIRIQGDAEMAGVFARLEDPNRRVQLNERLAAYGVSSTEERFETQTAPDGAKWKESIRAREAGGLTLVDAPRLSVSFSPAATKDEAAWGTNVMYAAAQHFGVTIRPKNKKALFFALANGDKVAVKSVTLPARPFLGVNDYDRQRLAGIAIRWGQEAMRA